MALPSEETGRTVPAGYDLGDHDALAVGCEELSALTSLAFAEYCFGIEPSLDFMAWFTARPGMARAHCYAARDAAGTIVSSVFATDLPLYLGAEAARGVAIDTVMTHPSHRGQGLARELLSRVIDAAIARGREAMVLFTGADSGPERLYASLGFTRTAVLAISTIEPVRPRSGDWHPDPAGMAQLLSGADELAPSRPGFRPYTPEYASWLARWPARGTIGGDAGYAVTTMCGPGGLRDVAIVTERLGLEEPDGFAEHLGSLPVLLVYDEAELAFGSAAQRLGFAPAGRDVAMVRPLSDSIDLGRVCGRPWYPMTESIIGV